MVFPAQAGIHLLGPLGSGPRAGMTIRWPRFHPAWRGRNPHVIPNVAERSEESKDSCLQNQVRGCQADALDSSAALRVVAGVNRPDVEIAGPKTCRTIVPCSYVLLPCWPTHQTGEGGESMTVQTLRSACPRCRATCILIRTSTVSTGSVCTAAIWSTSGDRPSVRPVRAGALRRRSSPPVPMAVPTPTHRGGIRTRPARPHPPHPPCAAWRPHFMGKCRNW